MQTHINELNLNISAANYWSIFSVPFKCLIVLFFAYSAFQALRYAYLAIKNR